MDPLLQGEVQVQVEVLTRLGRCHGRSTEFPDDASTGVEFDVAHTPGTLEHRLVLTLDTDLAHDHSRFVLRVEKRVGRQLAGRDLTHVPHDVARRPTQQVTPAGPHLHVYPGEVGPPLLQSGYDLEIRVGIDHDLPPETAQRRDHLLDPPIRQLHVLGHAHERGSHRLHGAREDRDGVAWNVVGEDFAVPIVNRSTWRGNRQRANPIGRRPQFPGAGAQHLDAEECQHQHAHEQGDDQIRTDGPPLPLMRKVNRHTSRPSPVIAASAIPTAAAYAPDTPPWIRT